MWRTTDREGPVVLTWFEVWRLRARGLLVGLHGPFHGPCEGPQTTTTRGLMLGSRVVQRTVDPITVREPYRGSLVQKQLSTRIELNTTFHPKTKGQFKRTIQVLKHMLWVCVIDCRGWDQFLALEEFTPWGTDLLHQFMGSIHVIQKQLYPTQSQKKSYVDQRVHWRPSISTSVVHEGCDEIWEEGQA
ncbi:hypothetical protein MTR67_001245 [Solanum verrucosum]|uniref:Uncharacterized protein n=1 Tax=Solanum verrucosum TaxID=315347 RepID=A0AAF0PRI7_SOLVR|nr:hypothetical protein MTR67_001245 [Solanum verrucosum]